VDIVVVGGDFPQERFSMGEFHFGETFRRHIGRGKFPGNFFTEVIFPVYEK